MKPATPKKAANPLKANEQKWSKPLMDAGWTAVPSIILEHQKALGLDPLDVNILLHLAMYWWKADSLPRPAKTTIAEALSVHPRTIQRRIAALEAAGLITRKERRTSSGSRPNEYDFSGLIKEATPFAKQKLADRAAEQKAQNERAAQRGRPRLVVDNDDDG